jgi:hypothetical protein
LNDEFIDEGFMRVCGEWLRERMQIYASGAALAAHTVCPTSFLSTLCMQRPSASNKTSPTLPFCAMKLHSVGGARRHQYAFWRTEGLSLAPDCFDVIAKASFGTRSACSGAAMAIGLYCWRTERSDIEARECSSGAVPMPKPKQTQISKDWQ